MRRWTIALPVALALAAPAAAETIARLRVTGVLDAPTGVPLGLPLAAGDAFRATLVLSDAGPAFATPPLGGAGQAAVYSRSLRALDIVLGTADGPKTISFKPNRFGNGFVYNNGFSVRAGGLIDYVGFIVPAEGGPGGITSAMTTDLALVPGVFLANFSFARVGQTGLINSTALPDFASFFGAPGATFFSLFSFRFGTASTVQQFNALPLAEVTVARQQVTVLPEPGSWVLMIAGFGAVGALSRRQRTATLAARL